MRKLIFFLGNLLWYTMLMAQIPYQERVVKPEPRPWGPYLWPHEMPENSSVSQSSDLAAAEFIGRSISYTAADTWYPSWASNQTVNSWVRLSWDKKVEVGKIWLFDRPYQYEQILSCGLKMSDGTIIELGALSNVEGEGLEITFEPKEVEWIEFVVLGVGNSQNSGLSEFAVFNK